MEVRVMAGTDWQGVYSVFLQQANVPSDRSLRRIDIKPEHILDKDGGGPKPAPADKIATHESTDVRLQRWFEGFGRVALP
jgi:hypothetical protein